MMEFKKITLDDISVIRPFFSLVSSGTCDFSVGGMFMWRKYYDMEYLIDNNVLYSRLRDENGNIYYNLPLAEDIEKAISECTMKWQGENGEIRFCTIPQQYLSCFLKLYPQAKVTEQTDYFDYLYNASDLMSFGGSKYHAQRNQINQFKRNYSDWLFADIACVSIDKIKDFWRILYASQNNSYETAIIENKMVTEVLENMDKYKMIGGALMVNGEIVGFSLGEIIGDTLFTHIEKANREYKGVYQLLTNEFAKKFGEGVKFINREEDMGDLGLRRAKEAYRPIELLKKYVIEVN